MENAAAVRDAGTDPPDKLHSHVVYNPFASCGSRSCNSSDELGKAKQHSSVG